MRAQVGTEADQVLHQPFTLRQQKLGPLKGDKAKEMFSLIYASHKDRTEKKKKKKMFWTSYTFTRRLYILVRKQMYTVTFYMVKSYV